ncbi:hypothetical protein M3C92_09090 [Dermabacter hominis]|uniref:hypothetical protein n=1 Tax=Dermabacter hominis TaxID=36740 RepID=UPI0021A53230|nr:hypothetical protein [Dermabacter hominis]MCT1956369.1 hypothetical protein [Dermabacter hominis]
MRGAAVARGVELATAYVTLAAETSEISKSIGKAFSNADRAATSAGTSMGRALKSAFAKEKPVDTEKLSKALESAERRHTAAVAKGARDRANAQRQVEVAEARVQEVRERTIRQAQAVKDAEKALERARKDGDPDQVAAAEKRLAEARDNVKPSSADLAAEDRLIRARQNQERVNLETASSVDKLEGELKDAKRAVDDAAKSTDSTARKFTSMGDRIKAAMKGDFGKAFARVKHDGKDAANDLERGFKKAGEDSGSGFSAGFKKLAFAAGGLFAIDQVKDFGFSSFMSAADLEQSTGAVETVFKQHSSKMLKYAQDADQALGMSENSYNELATILGTQLRNAGMKDFAEQTNDLIGLGADFSAMFGGTASEAVEAISSALKGERDPIEKYGISLRQSAIDAKAAELGFKKVGGSYDQQAQAAATLALINEQSTDAQGAFNRELKTSSNVIQRAKAWFEDFSASIGERLLPAFASVGNWILDKGVPVITAFGSRLNGVFETVGDSIANFKRVLATDWITPDLVRALGLDPSSGLGAVVQEAIGGVLAFKNAWVAFDGEVTSSGFPGFMEEAAFKARSFVEWVGQNWKPILGAAAGVAGAAAAKFGVFGKALAPLAAPARALFGALKPMAPLFRTLLGPVGLLGGAFGYLMASSDEFRGAVFDLGGALSGALMSTIEALVPLVTNIGSVLADVAPVLAGAILGALDALAPVLTTIVDGFSWLIGVLEPFLPLIATVGGAIFGVVKLVGGLMAAFSGIQAVVSGVVAAVSGVLTAVIPAVTGLVAAIGWIPLAIGAAIGALTWFFTQTKAGKAILAAVVDWITGTAWPALQGAFKAIGDAGVWLWKNAIIPAWDGIKAAIGAVVDWVMNSAVPFLKGAWDTVAGAAQWLWHSVIEPVWTGIKFAIALAIAAIKTYIDGWMWVFKNVVAPVFNWLWKSVIVPVWNAIKSVISSAINVVTMAVNGWVAFFRNIVAPAFNWLWRNVIVPVWNGIRSAINSVVSWFRNSAWPVISSVIENIKRGFNIMKSAVGSAWSGVKNAVRPVVDWFTGTLWPKISGVIENVKKGFNGMKDAVGKAWQGVKSAAIEPVNFVINKVYNEGIYSNFENVRKHIPGLPKLPKFQGFARGGILPGYSRMRDGDDQLVPMRRGEGVLVSEALRTARDKAAFLAVNSAGRRGQGFADTVGFAGGGILDKAGQLAGDVLDGGKKLLKGAWDFVSDPVGAFKGLVGGLFKKIPGAGFFKDLALGVGRKILDGVVSKVQSVFSPAGNPDAAPVSMPPGGSRSLGYAQAVARRFGLTMTSFRRGGARTAGSGVVSLHALGRAMDFSNSSGPTPQMMGFFNAMHPLKPTELLYSPAGRRQWRRSGRMADTSGVTKRMHYNHVHVGFAKGGIIPAAIIGGYKPFLHDKGGWHMPGELSINQTQKPEAVLTAKQWETVARSLDHATSSGVTVNVTAPTSQDPGVFGQRLGDALQLRQLAGSIA